MGKYLKKFGTQADYEAAQTDLIIPNVSFIVSNDSVYYNTNMPPTPSHDFVEIGGIKWATMNVGANSVTDAGLYFQWGDTQGYTASQVGSGEGQKYFDWTDYKYFADGGVTKYNGEDGLITLEPSDDALVAAWGGNWRMPTASEYVALGNAVNAVWTNDYQGSGVAGLICTDKTDSSKVLFFPASGAANNGSVTNKNSEGLYWSSSLGIECGETIGTEMAFSGSYIAWKSESSDRFHGFNIRGIIN